MNNKDDEKIWKEKKMNMTRNFGIGNLFDKGLQGKDSEKKHSELEIRKSWRRKRFVKTLDG